MFGKLLGAIVGLMLGLLVQGWLAAIIFAAIGAFVGHRYDELHQPPELDGEPDVRPPLSEVKAPAPVTVRAIPAQSRAEIDAQARAHFARHVCALFAEVARADGEIVRDEVRVVRSFFEEELRFSARELELVRTSLKAALAEPVELSAALEACTQELRASERLLLLDALYELALADGALHRSERERIKTIAQGLKIPAEDLRAVAALHFGDDRAHCERLGLTSEASDDEIKLAYRRLAAAHHPDKVAHLGPGAQERASRTFRELNEAYEELRRTRGF